MDETSKQFLEDLYVKYSNSLYLYAYSVLKDREMAKDAVQDAFQIACNKSEIIQNCTSPRAWIKQTLVYVISNMREKQVNASIATSNYLTKHMDYTVTFSPEENNPDLDLYPLSTTEEYRLVKANAIEGFPARELANSMNISHEAGKKRIKRAKDFLRKKLR